MQTAVQLSALHSCRQGWRHCVTVQDFEVGSGMPISAGAAGAAGAAKICDRRAEALTGAALTAAGELTAATGAAAGAGWAEATPAKIRTATNARSHVAFDIRSPWGLPRIRVAWS
jgi:hypothetical protein